MGLGLAAVFEFSAVIFFPLHLVVINSKNKKTVCRCVYVHEYTCADACRGQRNASDFLELGLKVVVSHPAWMLGTALPLYKSSKCSKLLSPSKYSKKYYKALSS